MQEKEYIYKLRDLNCILEEIKDLKTQYTEKKIAFNSMLNDFKSIKDNKGKPAGNIYLIRDYFNKDPS